jgi:CHAT domain-containing protein
LAGVLADRADFVGAAMIVRQVLKIRERLLGPEHPDTVLSLSNLGNLLLITGDYAAAESLIRSVLSVRERVLGEEHPDILLSVNSMAAVLAKLGDDQQTMALYRQGHTIEESLIENVFAVSSERERFAFLATQERERNAFLTFCVERMPGESAAEAIGYLLRRKGLVLDSLIGDADVARLSGDPELKDLVERQRQRRTRLATMAMSGPGEMVPEVYRAQMDTLRRESEEIEKELARKSARFRTGREMFRIGFPEVAAALPPGSALVEFAKYRSYNFEAKGREPRWGAERYIAYVLRAGSDTPVLAKLGEADLIESAIRAHRAELAAFAARRGDTAKLNSTSAALHTAVWIPLKDALGDARRVYLSPDGELNFVSFAGLRDATGRFVLEDCDLSYVSSGRDLARAALRRETPGEAPGPVLFAAPDYGGTPTLQEALPFTRSAAFRSELADLRSFGGHRFNDLPQTRIEAQAIRNLFGKQDTAMTMYIGEAACEARVKATESPAILHLATHGFFLPESGWGREREEGLELLRGFGMERTVNLEKLRMENPMHRSGLALAGANLTLEGRAPDGQEDGILTAEEVAGLELAGTRLVVLSACETGLGEARAGEGVLGLRRAFVRAGAENLVMTLWQVEDAATRRLMTDFYRRHLAGRPVRPALLEAQRHALAEQRQAGDEPNPFLWAGFVASGIGVE